MNQQILFRLGEERYGVDIFAVEEIVQNVPLQPAPTPSRHIAGMIQWRREVVPVYNLRARFGLSDAPIYNLMVVQIGKVKLALAVDQVLEIVTPEEGEVKNAPPLIQMTDTAYVSKVVRIKGQLVILLDLEVLMTEGEREKVEAMLRKKEKSEGQ